MPDGSMEWPVPVEIPKLGQRTAIRLVIRDGKLVLLCPATEVVIPATSDAVLYDAVQEAREVQRQIGRGLL